MAPTISWKKLKEKVVGRGKLDGLKSLNPKSLIAVQSIHGKNLLHLAAKKGCFEVCKYLIKIGCEVNLKEQKNGFTPLIYALKRRTKIQNIIKLLLSSGADMSWTNITIGKDSHVIFAKQRKIADMLCLALKRQEGNFPAAADHLLNEGWTFDNIAYMQNIHMTESALRTDKKLNRNFERLKKVITQGDVQQVRQLIDLVSHSERIISWLLEHAAKTKTPESPIIIKLLLTTGVPIDGFMDDPNGTPLQNALFSNNFDNSWILLNLGAKLEITNNNDLILIGKDFFFDEGDTEYTTDDCFRLQIEHRGVREIANYLQQLPDRAFDLRHQVIEYIAIAHNLSGKDTLKYSELKYNDIFFFDYSYYKECTEELQQIKNHKIEERVNFGNLLAISIDEMIPFSRNERLMGEINSESFLTKFPRYGNILQFKADKAFQKRLLMDNSINILSKCLPRIGSCLPALKKIYHYLNDPYCFGFLQKE